MFTVKDDGTTELLYSMKYDVYGGCLIPDDDTGSVVITGGNKDEIVTARVTRYDLQGFIEDLPQLNTYYTFFCIPFSKDVLV